MTFDYIILHHNSYIFVVILYMYMYFYIGSIHVRICILYGSDVMVVDEYTTDVCTFSYNSHVLCIHSLSILIHAHTHTDSYMDMQSHT